MVILSVDDRVCVFLFIYLFLMRCPAQGATGVWVMLGLYASGFLCVSSHYLIMLGFSSPVV